MVGRLPAGTVRLHDLNRRDPAASVDGAGAAELSNRASRSGHDPRRGREQAGERFLQTSVGVDRYGLPVHRRQSEGHVELLPLHSHGVHEPADTVLGRQGQLRPDRLHLLHRHADIGQRVGILPARPTPEECAGNRRGQIGSDTLSRRPRRTLGRLRGAGCPTGAGRGSAVDGPRTFEGSLAQGAGPGTPRR